MGYYNSGLLLKLISSDLEARYVHVNTCHIRLSTSFALVLNSCADAHPAIDRIGCKVPSKPHHSFLIHNGLIQYSWTVQSIIHDAIYSREQLLFLLLFSRPQYHEVIFTWYRRLYSPRTLCGKIRSVSSYRRDPWAQLHYP